MINVIEGDFIFQVKGLVKQHIDSFNYFINVEVGFPGGRRVALSAQNRHVVPFCSFSPPDKENHEGQ